MPERAEQEKVAAHRHDWVVGRLPRPAYAGRPALAVHLFLLRDVRHANRYGRAVRVLPTWRNATREQDFWSTLLNAAPPLLTALGTRLRYRPCWTASP